MCPLTAICTTIMTHTNSKPSWKPLDRLRYPTAKETYEYLDAYAQKFDLRSIIILNSAVVSADLLNGVLSTCKNYTIPL